MPLTITIKGKEFFNNETQKFYESPSTTLTIEHSLMSISKWEAIWKKPYLTEENKTNEELYSYIQCMTIKGDCSMAVLESMTASEYQQILDYIGDPMTASTLKKLPDKGKTNNFVTSELIYAWMVSYQINWECQKWHLNRLMILIGMLDEMNRAPKKKSEAELIKEYRDINERNKRLLKTRG